MNSWSFQPPNSHSTTATTTSNFQSNDPKHFQSTNPLPTQFDSSQSALQFDGFSQSATTAPFSPSSSQLSQYNQPSVLTDGLSSHSANSHPSTPKNIYPTQPSFNQRSHNTYSTFEPVTKETANLPQFFSENGELQVIKPNISSAKKRKRRVTINGFDVCIGKTASEVQEVVDYQLSRSIKPSVNSAANALWAITYATATTPLGFALAMKNARNSTPSRPLNRKTTRSSLNYPSNSSTDVATPTRGPNSRRQGQVDSPFSSLHPSDRSINSSLNDDGSDDIFLELPAIPDNASYNPTTDRSDLYGSNPFASIPSQKPLSRPTVLSPALALATPAPSQQSRTKHSQALRGREAAKKKGTKLTTATAFTPSLHSSATFESSFDPLGNDSFNTSLSQIEDLDDIFSNANSANFIPTTALSATSTSTSTTIPKHNQLSSQNAQPDRPKLVKKGPKVVNLQVTQFTDGSNPFTAQFPANSESNAQYIPIILPKAPKPAQHKAHTEYQFREAKPDWAEDNYDFDDENDNFVSLDDEFGSNFSQFTFGGIKRNTKRSESDGIAWVCLAPQSNGGVDKLIENGVEVAVSIDHSYNMSDGFDNVKKATDDPLATPPNSPQSITNQVKFLASNIHNGTGQYNGETTPPLRPFTPSQHQSEILSLSNLTTLTTTTTTTTTTGPKNPNTSSPINASGSELSGGGLQRYDSIQVRNKFTPTQPPPCLRPSYKTRLSYGNQNRDTGMMADTPTRPGHADPLDNQNSSTAPFNLAPGPLSGAGTNHNTPIKTTTNSNEIILGNIRHICADDNDDDDALAFSLDLDIDQIHTGLDSLDVNPNGDIFGQPQNVFIQNSLNSNNDGINGGILDLAAIMSGQASGEISNFPRDDDDDLTFSSSIADIDEFGFAVPKRR